nr:6601_t:CDS:10 [Entrophospora candida]
MGQLKSYEQHQQQQQKQIKPSDSIYPQPSDNNPIPYPQQSGLSSQLQNHHTYLITSRPQPDRRQRKKAKGKEPYVKRNHSLNACDPCRETRLRCEKKEGSDFCDRCIDEKRKQLCIFNKSSKKRGRKKGSKNRPKPKKNENENCDINAADNTVTDTKPCCQSNNKVTADGYNLREDISANPVIVDNQYYNAHPVLGYDDCYNANPQGGNNNWQQLEPQQLFQDNNNMSNILAISTDNYQTNAQQQSNPSQCLGNDVNQRCLGNNIGIQRSDNNQIPYPQSYTDQSAYQNQISYSPSSYTGQSTYICLSQNISYQPTYTDPHTDIDSKLFDNNQLQQPVLSFQFVNYPSTEAYLSNEQQGHMTPQSEYSVSKPDACSIPTNIQPKKDKQPNLIRHQQQKTAETNKAKIKRKHTPNACHSCRKAHIRCKKENNDSTSCKKCIRAEELCIFDENPGKRGRKPGIGNKPKENKTENRDVKVIKQCSHGNNKVVTDNLNLESIFSIFSPNTQVNVVDAYVNRNINAPAFNDGNGDDLQGGNCSQQLVNGYALSTSTYNHQTNGQQHWDEYVAELMQTFGIVIDPPQ